MLTSRKEYGKQYRKANAARIKARNAAYYQTNKEAYRDAFRAWKKYNPDKIRAIRQRWRDLNPSKQLLHQAKMRARKMGVPFNIDASDLIIPTHCPVLGILLVWTGQRGRTQPNVPSVDRIIPNLGYVKGNVRVISWRANRLKSDGALHEFKQLVAYLERERTQGS